MPEGVLMNESSPGAPVLGGFVDGIWSGVINSITSISVPAGTIENDMLYGPDAQGPLLHRTWDPYDRSVASWKIELCYHPIYESVQELYETEGTPFSADMARTYTRRFRVITRNPVHGPSAVCSCPGIPWPYAAYIPGRGGEYDLLARAIRISAKRESTQEHTSWIVAVEYSTAMPDGGPIPPSGINLGWSTLGAQNAPWDEPPHLEWDPDTFTRTPLTDIDGKSMENSAKQIFSNVPPLEEGVSVLIIRRNKSFKTLEEVRAHVERFSCVVNYDTFLGATRGQVFSTPPKAVERYRGPLRYWQMTYRLKFKKKENIFRTWLQDVWPLDTWQPKILDAGKYEIRQGWFGDDPAGTLVPIFRAGQPVNYDVPLKDGHPVAPGTQPTWKRFRYYPEVNFAEIFLPPSKL